MAVGTGLAVGIQSRIWKGGMGVTLGHSSAGYQSAFSELLRFQSTISVLHGDNAAR